MTILTIDRPIFILGNIRSGTTILYNLLSTHGDVCWFSNYSDRYPSLAGTPLMHRALDVPGVGDRIRRAIIENRPERALIPRPHEGDRIYHAYAGFGQERDGVERRLTDDMVWRLESKIKEHLRLTGRKRFLSKQTANNRRIELLHKMFPDAYYIHSLRDGRAVASSTLRVPWWNDTYIWWLGHTAATWEENGGEPIELAAMYWQRGVEEVWRHRDTLGERFMEIRYEDLTRDTRGVVQKIVHFCRLADSPGFVHLIPETLPNMNYKWREHLTEAQKIALDESIGDFLAELGYS